MIVGGGVNGELSPVIMLAVLTAGFPVGMLVTPTPPRDWSFTTGTKGTTKIRRRKACWRSEASKTGWIGAKSESHEGFFVNNVELVFNVTVN